MMQLGVKFYHRMMQLWVNLAVQSQV
jgi:hypothetical protein